jgi:hypothetical protein
MEPGSPIYNDPMPLPEARAALAELRGGEAADEA